MLTSFAEKPQKLIITSLPERMLLVAFNEDIRQVEAPADTVSEAWEADQYTLVIPALPGMAKRIEANYDAWLKKAKVIPTPEATAKQRLDDLEAAMIEIASIVGGE